MAYFSICIGFQKGDFLPQVLTSFKQHLEQLRLKLYSRMEEQDCLMISEVKIEIDVAEDTAVFWMMENSNQGQ